MALRPILAYPDSLLKQRAAPVSCIGSDVARLIEDMTETMYAAPGVGLAATQVGVSQRVIVLDVHDEDEAPGKRLLKLINPEIVEREGTIVWEEGCLSVPDLTAPVTRARRVLVRAWTPEEREIEVEGEELLAVALQHEIDHLEGKLFLDRLSRLKRDLYRARRRKLERQGRKGAINVHASLLPRHRGAAPVQWAILAGDRVTGVTIMVMNEEMDAGDVLLERQTSIADDDTAGTLGDRLAHLGAAALAEAIDGLQKGTLRPRPQPTEGVTFAPRIEREQGRLDWWRPAEELARVVRAFAPVPSAFTTFGGRVLKVHRAVPEPGPAAAPPGAVLDTGPGGILVMTGAGRLPLPEVHP